ncbi:hypothetical protein M0804_007926 [Polistes exclamans]|nr:hypothetical protein M0804_007926 [Polistes exclamans]
MKNEKILIRGWIGRRRRASGIVRPVSTSTLMTTALTLLLILLPAAFPDKINIGEFDNDSCSSNRWRNGARTRSQDDFI